MRWLARAVGIALLAFVVFSVAPVLALRWVHPWTSAFMLEASFAARTEREPYVTRYTWRDLGQISREAPLAVVASEDQRFPFHWGFDFDAIQKAVRNNERGEPIHGASTISQQVAKNLFLWGEQSYLRKGLEAWFTVLIERLWPKQRILEVYLNIAQFGRGIYGVEAAARQFYRKPASRLTSREAAQLAAVLPNPRRLHADAPSPYVEARTDTILAQMRALGGPAYLKGIVPGS
jgi:monofunctional biosynthetic peptidoglycan transglycosylase